MTTAYPTIIANTETLLPQSLLISGLTDLLGSPCQYDRIPFKNPINFLNGIFTSIESSFIPNQVIDDGNINKMLIQHFLTKLSTCIEITNSSETENLIKKYGFTLENPSEILPFVEENPNVIDVLKEAKTVISKYFKNSKLVLNLYKDIEENYEVLNILILNNLPAIEALEMEEAVFNNWFFYHYKNLKGKVTIREHSI